MPLCDCRTVCLMDRTTSSPLERAADGRRAEAATRTECAFVTDETGRLFRDLRRVGSTDLATGRLPTTGDTHHSGAHRHRTTWRRLQCSVTCTTGILSSRPGQTPGGRSACECGAVVLCGDRTSCAVPPVPWPVAIRAQAIPPQKHRKSAPFRALCGGLLPVHRLRIRKSPAFAPKHGSHCSASHAETCQAVRKPVAGKSSDRIYPLRNFAAAGVNFATSSGTAVGLCSETLCPPG